MDAAAVAAGVWSAYAIRFSDVVTAYIPVVAVLPPLTWYTGLSLILSLATVLSMLRGQMYRFPRQDTLIDELLSSIKFFAFAYVLVLAGLFFYRGASFSRLTMTLLFFTSAAGLVTARFALRRTREFLYRRGLTVRRAAIVGDSTQASRIQKLLESHPEYGMSVIGCIADSLSSNGLRALGTIAEAGAVVRKSNVDTLIVSPSVEKSADLPRLVRACYGVNVDFLYLPDIDLMESRPRRVVEVVGVPLWTLKDAPFQGWPGIIKRGFDLTVASTIFVLTLPIQVIIAGLIKLDSRGSVLYRQRRVGMDGRQFECLKFRSMRVNAEDETGPVWAKAVDARVTRMGRLLRRWSLDELPQLWNVLRGDMSLVGPRPERPAFVQQFMKSVDGYAERHRVRAGLTGWAQVNGLRGDTTIEKRTQYDRCYVENWSLAFDLKILLLTVKAVLKGENAY